MTSVLFVASEAFPFAKTGGLADVIGSLPKELNKQGLDARVIMPKYGDIPAIYKDRLQPVAALAVPVGWRRQYCGIESLEHDGTIFYFVDNEYYFKRNGLYGFYDDGERFAYFCRAVLDALPAIGFQPDVLHCHDWHAGMVAVLLDAHYRDLAFYRAIRTVFTVHNLQYQGVFPQEVLGDLLALDDSYFTADGVEFYGQVSFLKGGLMFSDLLTTVSPSYAEEIKTAECGQRMDGLLRSKAAKLSGILNGLDYEVFNPGKDSAVFVNYTWRSAGRRRQNKGKLQEFVGLPVREDCPVVAMVSRLVQHKGLDLITSVLEDLLAKDIQLVIIGTGEEKYEDMFRVAAHRYPDKISANIFFDDSLARKIYAGADLFLMPSLTEPCGIGQLIAMRYGCVPVVRETGGLKDTVTAYNEQSGEGNGFSFADYNAHDMLYTINRALSFYHNQDVWPKIVKNAMKTDYSWRRSARRYSNLYASLVEQGGN